jgi:solute:Na+ symporter, SSS family
LFLPQYFRGEMFTAYELMRRRFGERIRRLTAGTFLVLRALAEGVRVFAISIVISIVLGTGEIVSILVIVCLTLFYTFEGGMTAVIWTDAVQMFLYVGGAILSFAVILREIPGGWPHVAILAGAAHKFQMFDFRFAWTPEFFSRSYSFWAGLIGGCFLTTASHGTEQLLVQRLLAAKNEQQSRAALLSSWVVIFFQFALFLFIGVLLFVHYSDARLPAPQPADSIYPKFVWDNLPVGAAGLVMAAILAAGMSNLSAALNALASTTVMDFYKPLAMRRQRAPSDAHFLGIARWATVGWGVVLFLVGLVARHVGSVLEAGLTIASILYGSLLGVFLLGLLTKRVQQNSAMIGMIAGLLLMIFIRLETNIAFTWYVVIGTAATFSTGYVMSLFLREPPHDRSPT